MSDSFSHYFAPYACDAMLAFGHLHPSLFWKYVVAVSPPPPHSHCPPDEGLEGTVQPRRMVE
jgi:hypothetical protein